MVFFILFFIYFFGVMLFFSFRCYVCIYCLGLKVCIGNELKRWDFILLCIKLFSEVYGLGFWWNFLGVGFSVELMLWMMVLVWDVFGFWFGIVVFWYFLGRVCVINFFWFVGIFRFLDSVLVLLFLFLFRIWRVMMFDIFVIVGVLLLLLVFFFLV